MDRLKLVFQDFLEPKSIPDRAVTQCVWIQNQLSWQGRCLYSQEKGLASFLNYPIVCIIPALQQPFPFSHQKKFTMTQPRCPAVFDGEESQRSNIKDQDNRFCVFEMQTFENILRASQRKTTGAVMILLQTSLAGMQREILF